MSQYIKLLQHNGGFISVLADDNGVIQYTTNDADFSDIPGGAAATADAPTDAAAFSGILGAANSAVTTLAAPGVNLDVTGLTGDTDGDYDIEGQLTLTGHASVNIVSLLPNNLATNQAGQAQYFQNTSAAATPITQMLINTPTNTANSLCTFRGRLSSKSGRNRIFTCYSTGTETAGTLLSYNSIVSWSGTATAITSLRINADRGMQIGSWVKVTKLRRTA